MTRFIILAATLLLAACNDDNGEPGHAAQQPASCAQWTVQYSANVPKCFADTIDFPVGRDGVHYIVRPAPNALHGKVMSLRFELTGAGRLIPVPDARSTATTPLLRLYLMRAGGEMTLALDRWWSREIELKNGEHVIEHKLVPEDGAWSSVNAQRSDAYQAEFNRAVNGANQVGFPFGGDFAGHGVYAVDGPVRFRVIAFEIR
jgi:hypothetical protein